MKLFVITGESSGDLHASDVVRVLKRKHHDIVIKGWGGDKLDEAGMEIKVHIKELAVMGITDVIKKMPFFYCLYRKCKSQIKEFKPDALLLVDYSGFNLRIAQWAKEQNIKVHFYIAPKTWAWRASRNKIIARSVDHLYCIFPFEEKYFRLNGVNATYVGNSLSKITKRSKTVKRNTIAVLPGSRVQELKSILPVIRGLIEALPDYTWIISKVPHIPKSIYNNILGEKISASISEAPSHDLLASTQIALITSGTATLEASIIGCPQVVMYKTSILNYFIGKRFIKSRFISLPNILLDESFIDERIQNDLTLDNLILSIREIETLTRLERIKEKYEEIRRHLGDKNPANIVAKSIINLGVSKFS